MARAVLAAFALAAAELLLVAALHRKALTSGWELTRGLTLLVPSGWLAIVPPALLGAVLAACLDAEWRVRRGLVATLLGAWGGVVTAYVATGRHFAAPGRREGLALLVAASVGLSAYALFPVAVRLRRARPAVLRGLVLGAIVLLEAVNALVLVRLYPAFHAGLAFLTVALAPLLLPPEVWPAPRARRDLAAAGLVVVASALAAWLLVPSARRLSGFDNFRLVVAEGAPVGRHAVLLAADIAPPPPLTEVDPCLLTPSACTPRAESSVGPSFAGHDLVLVTIDALRADHVSAYGYPRPTTPNLDALARESVTFDRAYCATPHTSYSVTSLMTGKYMRPLLLQGKGGDSETLASYLRTYGYRTAAFYPPAVFFIDQGRFTGFESRHFGFEYAKVEFMEGEGRAAQIEAYLDTLGRDQRLFLWVHLFGPHEPYEAHPEHPFGDRDVDRYDSEIAAADWTLGKILGAVRSRRPGAVAIVTADHGEEFGEHGGRYHGTSVYEEQVRVPLVVSAPGLLAPRRVREVVESVDLVPTVLAALSIPRSPRIRGRDIGPLLTGASPEKDGFASAETDDWALLAEGPRRLVCERKVGACRLYDLDRDPGEKESGPVADPETLARMRTTLQGLAASHGSFETRGEGPGAGRAWPSPILRGIAGDADASADLASLLDDADRDIRRKAAELLFELHGEPAASALRLALSRDEDPDVRRYAALALTRLGQTVPLTLDLLNDGDLRFRRLAALALGEAGDRRGQDTLIDFYRHLGPDDHARALDLLRAFAKCRTKDAVPFLVRSLSDVRLRPELARTLAAIGDEGARGPLLAALTEERHQTARIAITDALVALGAHEELARPLVRFLGTPDPLPGGLDYALRARVLDLVGGPDAKGLRALETQAGAGVSVRVAIPKGGNGTGVRVLVRAWAEEPGGSIRIGERSNKLIYNSKREAVNARNLPRISDANVSTLKIPAAPADRPVEVAAVLPPGLGALPGKQVEVVVFAERPVHVEALALVPLADELPPPPPEPWSPSQRDAPGEY